MSAGPTRTTTPSSIATVLSLQAAAPVATRIGQPNGVAMRNGALYVATRSRLLRFDDIEKHLDAPPTPVVLRSDLPNPTAVLNLETIQRIRPIPAFGDPQMVVHVAHNLGQRRHWMNLPRAARNRR